MLAKKKFTIVKTSTHKVELRKLKKHELWQDEMLSTATA
jgi:hypothetical protein